MGKESNRLKRCSTSTDVEAEYDKGTKPSQKAEIEQQTDVDPKKSEGKQTDEEPKKKKKKTSKMKEMKKLRKSFQEMTETLKNLQDVILLKADLPGMSLKELLLIKLENADTELTPKESDDDMSSSESETREGKLTTYECCYETEDLTNNDDYTLLVKGLDTSRGRDHLVKALEKHFESCGCEVTRVWVPIECETGVPLGIAYVDVDDEQKALKRGRGYMEGYCPLMVMLALNQPENSALPNFTPCGACGTYLARRRQERFLNRRR